MSLHQGGGGETNSFGVSNFFFCGLSCSLIWARLLSAANLLFPSRTQRRSPYCSRCNLSGQGQSPPFFSGGLGTVDWRRSSINFKSDFRRYQIGGRGDIWKMFSLGFDWWIGRDRKSHTMWNNSIVFYRIFIYWFLLWSWDECKEIVDTGKLTQANQLASEKHRWINKLAMECRRGLSYCTRFVAILDHRRPWWMVGNACFQAKHLKKKIVGDECAGKFANMQV